MVTAVIEFFIPGSHSPITFELEPELVYIWEQLLIKDGSETHRFSIRREGLGLTTISCCTGFKTTYPALDFSSQRIKELYPVFQKAWESRLLEFHTDGSLATAPLNAAGDHSWGLYLKKAIQGPGVWQLP